MEKNMKTLIIMVIVIGFVTGYFWVTNAKRINERNKLNNELQQQKDYNRNLELELMTLKTPHEIICKPNSFYCTKVLNETGIKALVIPENCQYQYTSQNVTTTWCKINNQVMQIDAVNWTIVANLPWYCPEFACVPVV